MAAAEALGLKSPHREGIKAFNPGGAGQSPRSLHTKKPEFPYFSDDEVKQPIQFYQTPLGQKWISMQPKVQNDLQPKARTWGELMGRETLMEVPQEHPDLAEQLKAATEAAHQH